MRQELQINTNPTQSAQGKFPFFFHPQNFQNKSGKSFGSGASQEGTSSTCSRTQSSNRAERAKHPFKAKIPGWNYPGGLDPAGSVLCRAPSTPSSPGKYKASAFSSRIPVFAGNAWKKFQVFIWSDASPCPSPAFPELAFPQRECRSPS